MKFKDLKFELKTYDGETVYDGRQAKVMFANGYGASVITGYGAYGNIDAPYELAVLKGDGLCYDTPITDDVLGHLTEEDLDRLLAEIEALE